MTFTRICFLLGVLVLVLIGAQWLAGPSWLINVATAGAAVAVTAVVVHAVRVDAGVPLDPRDVTGRHR